jgi:hypothetical protein
MSINKLTKDQLCTINELKNPNLTCIIQLAKDFGIDPKIISDYLITQELKKLNKDSN